MTSWKRCERWIGRRRKPSAEATGTSHTGDGRSRASAAGTMATKASSCTEAAMKTGFLDRYVIARERNVVRVNFRQEPDPPAPKFPGAGALRNELSETPTTPSTT